MPRNWNRTDTNSVRDRKSRDIFIKVDEYLIEVSKQLTTLIGGAQGVSASESLTPGATGLGVSIVDQPFITVSTDNTLLSERTLAVSSSFSLTDGGAKGAMTIGVGSPFTATAIVADTLDGACRVAPAFTLGTANVIGSALTYVPSNSTLALFDAVTGADLASTASNGAAVLASRSDHVHRFPTSLMEYTNSKTLALTSTGTVSTLTTGSGVTALVFSGPTTIRAAATNTINLGATGTRFLSGWFGTTGINNSGPSTLTGAVTCSSTLSAVLGLASFTNVSVAGDFNPNADLAGSIGSGLAGARWGATYTAALNIVDVSDVFAFNVELRPLSSTALTADRILTLDMVNADRTLKLTGNAVLDQDVSTAGSPTFVDLTVTEITGTGAALVIDSDSVDPKVDGNTILGSAIKRWSGANFDTTGISIQDQSADKMASLKFNSVAVPLTAARTLTVDLNNASRILKLAGNVVFPSGSAYTVTNGTTDRAYDANATSIDEMADVLGTLIADLKTAGVIT